MQVKTTIKTLCRFQKLLNDLGLKMNKDGKMPELNLMQISNELLTEGKLIDFIIEITGDANTDWENEPLSKIKEVLELFFTGIVELLPKSMLDSIKALYLQNLTK